MELTYDEITEILDKNFFPSKRTSYILPHEVSEITDINKTLEFFLPHIVKVSITIDDIRLRSNSISNEILGFTKKHFSIRY